MWPRFSLLETLFILFSPILLMLEIFLIVATVGGILYLIIRLIMHLIKNSKKLDVLKRILIILAIAILLIIEFFITTELIKGFIN